MTADLRLSNGQLVVEDRNVRRLLEHLLVTLLRIRNMLDGGANAR